MTPENVRLFIGNYLESKLVSEGSTLGHLSDDCDLLLDGFIDSFDLLQLVAALREHYGREIDFEGLAPNDMTVVGPLCKHVSMQLQ